MIALGLALVVVAAVVGVEFVISNTAESTVEVFNQTLTGVSPAGVFLVGAAATLLLLMGISLIGSGFSRAKRRRVERKEASAKAREIEREASAERDAAVAEADRLREELTQERMAQVTLGGMVPPPAVPPGEEPP